MRIVKEWSIEDINITVFRMEQRLTLKLEWNRLEQVFKLDARDGIEDIEKVEALLDESFIQKVKLCFNEMNANKMNRLKQLDEITGEEFPFII